MALHGGTEAITFAGAGKRFSQRWVVQDLDLVVPAGTIFGLIGPSGCGKTTTVKLAAGLYRPDAGEVRVLGEEPTSFGDAQRAVLGYLPQHPVLFDELSCWENANFHASLNGVRLRGRRRRLRQLFELVDLSGEERKRVGAASGGMRRRLGLVAAMVHAPPVLLLDEPTAGIDPILRQRFWEYFRELRDGADTLLITTQHVDEAARCDLVGMLADGALIAVGTPAQLRRAAYGGELLEVELDQLASDAALDELLRVEGVHDVEIIGRHRLRLVVEDAGGMQAVVFSRLEPFVRVLDLREVPVDYDDVFIQLVAKSRLVDDGRTRAAAPGRS